MSLDTNDEFVRREFAGFTGARLLHIRGAKQVELEQLGWDDWHPTIVMLFDNGKSFIVSQDEEGNGPGSLFAGTWSAD